MDFVFRYWHSSTIDRRAEHGSSARVLQTSIFAASARLKASRLTNSTAVILLRAHAPPDIEGPDEITCQVGANSGALDNSEHQVPTCVRRIAYCHLLLRGSRWMPVSVNRKLGPNDRCSPNGAVISAFLSAAIDRDTIVGWLKNSAFSIREVRPDGSLSGLDFRAAALVTHADEVDMEARRSGAVGIASLIAQPRIQEQNAGGLPVELREAAFERAAIQILDKLQGHSVVGVLLPDC